MRCRLCMGGNVAGNSVKQTQQIPCLALPEASSDDCSAVHPYPSIADNHATSEQLAAKQTSAAQSKLASTQLLRGKRKQPEPSPTLEEAQLKLQLSSNPEARQESSVQTPAPETLVSPNKHNGRRKPAKATSAAEASAQSTPTAGEARILQNHLPITDLLTTPAMIITNCQFPVQKLTFVNHRATLHNTYSTLAMECAPSTCVDDSLFQLSHATVFLQSLCSCIDVQ